MTTSMVTARRKGDPQHYVDGKVIKRPKNIELYIRDFRCHLFNVLATWSGGRDPMER